MNPETIAENVKRYLAKYEAMVKEGERKAAERREIVGDHEFDSSKYIVLKDLQPARIEWRKAQAESVTIINALVELVREMDDAVSAHNALLACYRTGKRPTEKLFREMERAKNALSKAAPIAALAKGE